MLAMAIRNISINPLFGRLTRRPARPGWRACLGVALASTLGGLAVMFGAILLDPLARHSPLAIPIPSAILLLNGLIRIVSLPALAVVIARSVARAAEHGELRLIQVSRMTDPEIVEGFITAGLYRLRLAWATALGLALPTLAAILYQSLHDTHRLNLCVENTLGCLMRIPPETMALDVATAAIMLVVDYLVYYGWLWLASYASVWVALRIGEVSASTGALALPLIVIALYLAESYSVIGLIVRPLTSTFPTFGYCGSGFVLPLLIMALRERALERVRLRAKDR